MIVLGRDSSDKAVPLLVDSTGRVIVVGVPGVNDFPLQRNVFFSNLALPAGTSNQTVTTVPGGETWRVRGGAIVYVGTVAGVTFSVFGYDGANSWVFGVNNAPVSGQWAILATNMILDPGEQIIASVVGATLNDDLYVSILAERIK